MRKYTGPAGKGTIRHKKVELKLVLINFSMIDIYKKILKLLH